MPSDRKYDRLRTVGGPMVLEPRPRVVRGGSKYTGRGLGWARKAVRKREARRIARYNAGVILDAVLSDGWEPDALIEKFGKDGLEIIKDHLLDIALWLRETGDPDGESTR